MHSIDVNGTATTRYGMARAWWLDVPGMDLDHWGVMAALATYADETGACHPSQGTLARRLKRSRPWVNRVIADLAKAGLLRKTARTRTANPGTTSCEYTLALRPSDLGDPVTPVTPPSHATDTGCQGGDTNHLKTKLSNSAPADAHAPGPSLAPMQDAGRKPETRQGCPIPDGWRPAPDAMAAAQALAPDVDLEIHATMFAAKSRAKGYLYQAGRASDAWLSWLAEDRLRHGHRRRPLEGGHPGHGGGGKPADHGERRFAAWANAATAPHAASLARPARSENENPWN